MTEGMVHRLLAIVTVDPLGTAPLWEMRGSGDGNGAGEGIDLRVVVPAVEANALRHTLGDIDEPRHEAEGQLERLLDELRSNGIEAAGEVGDPDPIQAAQDALLVEPADEILIFEHEEAQSRWFEEGLLEKAGAGLEPPLRMVGHEIGSAYLPGLSRPDFAGMVAGIVGTIVAAVLAAAVTAKDDSLSGRAAAAILVAIGIAPVILVLLLS